MTLRQSLSRAGDYSQGSNFGKLAARPDELQGALVVAATAEPGKGRVLAFADSTVLSSFAYFIEAHSDLVLRGVTWLNRSPSWMRILKWLWLILGLAACTLVLRAGWSIETGALLFIGGLLGSLASTAASARSLRVPAPSTSVPQIGIVAEGGHAWLPPVLGDQPEVPEFGNLMTFIQIPQRLGCETRIVPREPEVLEGLDALVLLNPDVESGQPEAPMEWVAAVRSWVQQGGRLLVTQRRGHVGHAHGRASLYLPPNLGALASVCPEIDLSGADLGSGKVVRLIGSEVLDVEGLGHCMSLPTSLQRRRYEACYQVFAILGGLPDERRRTYLISEASSNP
jgi:hypothetical protein